MRVKLCGNTSLEDARMGAAAGADALGFIFAPHSKRFISLEKAAPICSALAKEYPAVERIGVFTHSDAATMAAIIDDCALTGVQLQSPYTQLEARELPAHGVRVRFIAALPWAGSADFAARLAADHDNPFFDAFLVDNGMGGTGQTFSWSAAAASFANAAQRNIPVIAAGGLTPENVTEAVTTLHCYGVDVVSGVESAPGKKDARLAGDFIRAARAAGRSLGPRVDPVTPRKRQ